MLRGAPLAYPGQRIGLFGGSFDPAHEGHAHVAETALKRLGLDVVWWSPTPQNPLKPKSAALVDRAASARKIARGRKMRVTTFEAEHGFGYTYQTVKALRRAFPGVHFVLIVGGDSLQSFRRWRRWRDVMDTVPLAIVARPGAGARARFAKPAQAYSAARKPQSEAHMLASARAPAWTFLNARFHPHSSSEIRKGRQR
jgi:nicotinate-nucleotide adenylyltransferase